MNDVVVSGASPDQNMWGGHMVSAERELITGVWGRSRGAPSGVQGQSPWSWGQGAKSP